MDFKKPNSIVISGTGSYVPEKVLTNNDLSEFLDTSDEWIFERSGIRRRHIAADGEAASDMALHASRNALEMAGIDEATAKEAMRLAGRKLPIKTKFVSKSDLNQKTVEGDAE